MISIDACIITSATTDRTNCPLLCIVDATTITVYVVKTTCTISDSVTNLITISVRVATRVGRICAVIYFLAISLTIAIAI